MNDITVIAAADEKYAMLFCTMAASVLKHANYEDNYRFKLLTDGFSLKTENKIKALTKIRECKIDFINVDIEELKVIPTLSHLSPLANARIKAISLLPEVKKAIYLDCDIIVMQDLKTLWQYELGGNPIAACMDYGAERKYLQNYKFILEDYFNSGVVIMDFPQIKKMNMDALLNEALSRKPNLPADQDILNAIFKDKWTRLPLCWNIQPELSPKLLTQYSKKIQREFRAALRNPAIIHYGGRKPTTYLFRGRYQKEFWECLKLTEYRNYKMTDISFCNFLRKHVPNFLQILYCRFKSKFTK